MAQLVGLAFTEVSKNEIPLKLQRFSFYYRSFFFSLCFNSKTMFALICKQIIWRENRHCVSCRRRTKYPTNLTIILFFCRLFWSRADFLGCYRFVPATSLSFCHGVLPWPCPRPGSVWCREPQTSLLPFTAWISKSPPSIPSKLHWWD